MSPTPTKPSRAPRRRNRPTLSCGHCRLRKLKCNRASPCESCVKSGDAATCLYGPNERQRDVQPSTPLADKDALTSRIDRLESLLLSVVKNAAHGPAVSSLDSDVQFSHPPENKGHDRGQRTDLTTTMMHEHQQDTSNMVLLGRELGVMKVEATRTVYHGGHHWVSTMLQIQEFRDYLQANSTNLERAAIENQKACSEKETVVSLLRGVTVTPSKEELLLYLPPRGTTDMLVTRFFDYICSNILLHYGALSFSVDDGQHCPPHWVGEFRRRTIQCLVAANYTNPQSYTVEVLILHTYTEWVSSQDNNIEASLLLGIAIRLAMRMGMHRDPRAHDGVTPFQGEMRRRTWTLLRLMDTLFSLQLSLPAAIHHDDSLCAMPRNIFDSELHSDMTDLPPARPMTEVTEISYVILKARLVLELGKILTYIETETDSSHDAISKYEQSLEEIRSQVPPHLSATVIPDGDTPSMELRRRRINLDRMYQIGQCVLHRNSLAQARHDVSKLPHRGSCIDAAMTLLTYQAALYLDSSPPFPDNIHKRHIYTLTTHDFFTAAMAVALDLHYGFEAEPVNPSPSDIALWGYDRRDEMIAALETSIEFCRIGKDESVEAANAYGMLRFVVAKARKVQWMIAEQQVGQTSTSNPSATATAATVAATATPVPELGTEIFADPLPGFDWDLRTPFHAVYGYGEDV